MCTYEDHCIIVMQTIPSLYLTSIFESYHVHRWQRFATSYQLVSKLCFKDRKSKFLPITCQTHTKSKFFVSSYIWPGGHRQDSINNTVNLQRGTRVHFSLCLSPSYVAKVLCFRVVGPSVRLCVCEAVRTVNTIFHKRHGGISPNLQLLVQFGTNMNWLDYEVKRSKVKVKTTPYMVKTLKHTPLGIDGSPLSSV